MKYRPLGPSGLYVSAIGLGGMPLSLFPERPAEVDAIAVIHHAVDCGVTLIDTADSYCIDDTEAGHNERLIGKALGQLPAATRNRLVVATKGGLVRPQRRWERNGRPEHLRKVVDESLRNLRTPRIDVYQYHRIDPKVPLADSIGELKRLQEAGKIAHVAVSNFSVAQVNEARKIVPIVSVQNQYAPGHRTPELPVSAANPAKDPDTAGTLKACTDLGLALLAWSPLNGIGNARNLGKDQPVVTQIAADHRVSVQQVALAWLLAKSPVVIPIPGASRKSSIEDSAKAADLMLSESELHQLDEAWKPAGK